MSPAGVYLSAHDHGAEAMAGSGSFEEFYTGAVGRLLGQLFPVTGDLHEAEEVVQEAFTRAAARWSRLRDYDVPEAWVRLRPPSAVPGASDEALALVEALRTLPIRQRQVLVLHYLVDLPVDQVAHTLRMPEGTVKSLLSRGRQMLASKLGEAEEVLYPQ